MGIGKPRRVSREEIISPIGGIRGDGTIVGRGGEEDFYYTEDEIIAAWYGVTSDAYAAWQQACNGDGWYAEYCRNAGPRGYLSEKEAEKVIDAIIRKARGNGEIGDDMSQDDARYYVAKNLEFATWGVDGDGKVWIQSYKLKGGLAHVYWGPDVRPEHGNAGDEYFPTDGSLDALENPYCYQDT